MLPNPKSSIINPTSPPLTDSPWFWLRLFSYAALIVLVAIGPKYSQRQRQIELQYQSRQDLEFHGEQQPQDGSRILADDRLIPLRPLAAVALACLAVAEGALWRRRYRNMNASRGKTDELAV